DEHRGGLLMVFALDDLTGGGAIVGLVLAAVGLLAAWFANGRRMVQRVDDLTKQVFALQIQLFQEQATSHEKIFKLQEDAAHCRRRESDLKAEVVVLTRRMIDYEKHAGMPAQPAEFRSGVVVADLKGIVRVFSPSLVPLFKYLPHEVQGKPITMLMPEDVVVVHEK